MIKLAINGGTPVKQTPFSTGKRFGAEELSNLQKALEQNTLFCYKGGFVKAFQDRFAGMYGMPYCHATSSCTAAIHAALYAVGVGPGDEVITAPITDMGSVIGTLFQNAIPVFADIDPHTYNMDAASIEQCITPRTKAIMVVHLAGGPADMDAIMAVAQRHGVAVIEDCAQSFMTYYKGRLAGTIGDISCFSVNDYKHISAGDGGMVLTRDQNLARRARLFADKNYDREGVTPKDQRQVACLAANYRMNELTGAVALAQLDRLEGICSRRRELGDRLTKGLADLPGVSVHKVLDGCQSSYWFYMFRLTVRCRATPKVVCEALVAEGIRCTPEYIGQCIYEYGIFHNRNAYEGTLCPFDCPKYGGSARYEKGLCPVAEEVLRTCIATPVSEFYTDQEIDEVIEGIRKVVSYYTE